MGNVLDVFHSFVDFSIYFFDGFSEMTAITL